MALMLNLFQHPSIHTGGIIFGTIGVELGHAIINAACRLPPHFWSFRNEILLIESCHSSATARWLKGINKVRLQRTFSLKSRICRHICVVCE
jgi:hypothetical protein